jgi:hypothetical protein
MSKFMSFRGVIWNCGGPWIHHNRGVEAQNGPVVADAHHFYEQDPDPHSSENMEANPN